MLAGPFVVRDDDLLTAVEVFLISVILLFGGGKFDAVCDGSSVPLFGVEQFVTLYRRVLFICRGGERCSRKFVCSSRGLLRVFITSMMAAVCSSLKR